MKLYIEIETTGDRLCLFALDDILRQLSKSTIGHDQIGGKDNSKRVVFVHAATTDRFGNVVTAALVNKIDNS